MAAMATNEIGASKITAIHRVELNTNDYDNNRIMLGYKNTRAKKHIDSNAIHRYYSLIQSLNQQVHTNVPAVIHCRSHCYFYLVFAPIFLYAFNERICRFDLC